MYFYWLHSPGQLCKWSQPKSEPWTNSERSWSSPEWCWSPSPQCPWTLLGTVWWSVERGKGLFSDLLDYITRRYLNPLVDAAERGGEVLDGDVHVLQLLTELLPLVIAEGCQVKVDQLGREPRELVIEADAVVAALRHVALLILWK